MIEKVSSREVRRRMTDLLHRVSLRGDEYLIERNGKPMAALVPAVRLDQLRAWAKDVTLRALKEGRRGRLTEEAAMALANQSRAWSRGKGRKHMARTR